MPQIRRDDSVKILRELCAQAENLSRMTTGLADRLAVQLGATRSSLVSLKRPPTARKVRKVG